MRISDLSSDVCSSDLFGQQGAVIAVPEIGIILAQVDDLGALGLHEIRPGDELPVVEDQAAGIAVAEMGFSLDDNNVHGGGNGSRICPVAVRWRDGGMAAGRPVQAWAKSDGRCGGEEGVSTCRTRW